MNDFRPVTRLATGTMSVAAMLLAPLANSGIGDEIQARQGAAEINSEATTTDVVAAFVNGQPILVREVEFTFAQVLGNRQPDQPTIPYLKARTLQQLIEQELATQWLAAKNHAATDSEVALAIDRLQKRLAQRDITLADHLAERRIQRVDLDRQILWQLSWPRFLAHYLTDENLERYFRDHQVEFDGTQLHVAHILLAAKRQPGEENLASLDELRSVAAGVREKLSDGRLSFAEAARRFSVAPTAGTGGDIGLISRYDPMPEAFSAAAFRLRKGEVSQPVVTQFGVHLIKCLEIEPGQAKWTDVREALELAMKQYLFGWVVEQARTGARIEFTDNSPRFRPGTTQLVP